MKKLLLFLIVPLLSFGQKIYVTDYAYQADLKVTVVNYAYQADLDVYKLQLSEEWTVNATKELRDQLAVEFGSGNFQFLTNN